MFSGANQVFDLALPKNKSAPRGALEGRSDIRGLLAGLALALAPFSLHAHPHAWIDVRSTVIMSSDGMISAIEEEWLFDDLYSLAVIDEMAIDSPQKTTAVSDFAAKVIENLGPYGYFMRITADGRPVRIGAVTQFKSEMKGQQLLLSFTAPLAEPVDPMRYAVKFSVYDPSYFIQMTHRQDEPPAIRGAGKYRCQAYVKQPDPSPQAIARAFALDRGASPQDNLGDLFAEKVHIQCK
ncbi:MAG: DUF1007 family protein [Pollutimonas bauzanensis]|uniref:DUF1007 family protein n=1 Tax=Pollutimonas bauzanensis TaxID=658167 RepID=UPI000934779D|nr:DUF1007 family protein [Pollutimonas bauzanensis]